MRRYIDLTHAIFDGLPAYPGDLSVSIKPIDEIDNGGYRVGAIHMDGHTGTHVDVPRHVFADGRTLENIDLYKCIGPAVRVTLAKDKGEEITVEDLMPFKDGIARTRRLVLDTGWSGMFGGTGFYDDYPGISVKAANWLVELDIYLVAIDMPSPHFSKGLDVHRIFLRSEVVIIESLAWPDRVPDDEFELICLPLSIKGGDGSPARVIAVVQE